MNAELIVLRLVHVVGGMLWVGFAAYNTFFLLPSMAEAGPAGGPVIAGLQKRKLFVILPILALLVILAGFRLMMIAGQGSNGAWFHSRSGMVFSAGALIAIVVFVFGVTVVRPTMNKVMALSAERAKASPDRQATLDGEIAKLRRRAEIASKASTHALLLTSVTMAIGRYV